MNCKKHLLCLFLKINYTKLYAYYINSLYIKSYEIFFNIQEKQLF